MPTYSVRRATPADADALVRHRIRMFEDMGRLPDPTVDLPRLEQEYRAWLLAMMASGTYVSWVVDDHSPDAVRTIVAGGGATLIPWPPGPFYPGSRLAFVYNVYTEPEHRGRGLGRRVMNAVHEFCRAEGILSVALNASDFGRPLYEAMGYAVTPSPMMFLALR
jgi:GNAT superfamily N-acetyltransferase